MILDHSLKLTRQLEKTEDVLYQARHLLSKVAGEVSWRRRSDIAEEVNNWLKDHKQDNE
mgnify:CR=1 FL=1